MRTNIRTNMIFFMRNRLILLIGIIMLGLMGVSTLPSFFFMISENKFFALVQQAVKMGSFFTMTLIPLMGIISLHHHVSSRSIKMVITKPCTMENWIGAQFLSALILALSLHTFIAVLGAGAMAAQEINVPSGVVHIIFYNTAQTMIIFSWLFMLTSFMNPIISSIITLAFSSAMFRWLLIGVMAGEKKIVNPFYAVIVSAMKLIFAAFFFVLPDFGPYGNKLNDLEHSYQVSAGHTVYVVESILYALSFALMSICVSTFILRRRRLI